MGKLPRGIKTLLLVGFVARWAVSGTIAIVGLQVFRMTGRELDLGLIGAAEFLPIFLLAPFTGTLADRFDRRRVWGFGIVLELLVAAGMTLYIRTDPQAVGPIFGLMVWFGVARAIVAPAERALPIDLSPPALVGRVVALRSSTFQIATITGPVVAAWLYVQSPEYPYALAVIVYLVALVLLTRVPHPPTPTMQRSVGRQAIRDAFDGLRFIRATPILMGAISLDLFAVLLGGAKALLPAIADERLGVGAVGFGWLQAALGMGAFVTATTLAIRPMQRRVGKNLLGAVGVFGIGMIVLGLTTNFVVAFVALLVVSAADAISVYVRSALVPLATPAEMRGRVLAVENVFIGGSNELGAVESGLVGQWLGVMWAVVTGGIGTLLVVGLWWRFFPVLRDVDRLEEIKPAPLPG